jgi:adenylate cyclase
VTIRRLAAILAADVVGFSSMMEKDEEGTASHVRAVRREVIEPKLSAHQGRLVKTTGDGFLAEFASPVEAVRCALSIQDAVAEQADANGGLKLRIGINLGDIIIEDDGDVFGDGVNVATRLEQMADPGGVLISGKIYEEIEGKIEREFESRGEQQVKNLARPVRVYALAGVTPSADDSKPLPLPDKPSIAVLPFTNMSGDPEQEYFADGVVEDIITALSRVKWFFVIARNSSFTYKGRAVDVRQVGRELGVGYVLEGSIRKTGNRVRLTGQLIEAQTGHHVWADRFEGNLDDIFELQDQITSSVVGAIEPQLVLAETERTRTKRAETLAAYDLYLRAWASLRTHTEAGSSDCLSLLADAVQRDPGYASAFGLLAQAHLLRANASWGEPDVSRVEGVKAAHLALDVGPNDPVALGMAGWAVSWLGSEHEIGLSAVERSLALNPNGATAWSAGGYIRLYLCHSEQAIGCFEKALRLSPLDPELYRAICGIAFAQLISGRFDEAVSTAKKALQANSRYSTTIRVLASAYANLNAEADARRTVQRLLELEPRLSLSSLIRRSPRCGPEMEIYVGGLRKAGLPE